MKQPSKITLSDEERRLVNNSDWILTKQAVTGKVFDLFGQLSENYKRILDKQTLPPSALQYSPKISRGENYRGLPYVILDYPRCFEGKNIFAIRTMFWWGNFFSSTLLLSGEYKKMFAKNVCDDYGLLKQHGFYACINEDPWQHHFEEDNYRFLQQQDKREFEKTVEHGKFIKLAINFPLNDWDKIPVLLEGSFLTMMQLLKS